MILKNVLYCCRSSF